MATDAVQRQPLSRSRSAPINRTRERIFFAIMALLMVATILLGFRASPSIILHATVFSLFLLLFVVQTTLIAAHRTRWHMQLGLWLYGLAALMVPLGILAAFDELRRDLAAGRNPAPGIDPRTFSMISIMGIAVFAVLMAWSYAQRRHRDAHKRLALYAVLCMMNAGTDRWLGKPGESARTGLSGSSRPCSFCPHSTTSSACTASIGQRCFLRPSSGSCTSLSFRSVTSPPGITSQIKCSSYYPEALPHDEA